MDVVDSYLVEFVQWLLAGFDVYLEELDAVELLAPLAVSLSTITVSIMLGAFFQMFTTALGAMFGKPEKKAADSPNEITHRRRPLCIPNIAPRAVVNI